jgi:Bacterial Ig-like domain (group 2)
MVELTNGQAVDLTVAYTDSAGTPAQPPGAVSWSSSDPSIATVEAHTGDDTMATVHSVADGAATVTAESAGITSALDIIVGAAEGAATEGTITAGEPYSDLGREPGQPGQGLPGGGLPGRQPGQLPDQQRPGMPQRPGVPQPQPRPGQPTPRPAVAAAAVVRPPVRR